MDILNQVIDSLLAYNSLEKIQKEELKKLIASSAMIRLKDKEPILKRHENIKHLYVVQKGRIALLEDGLPLVKMTEGDIYPIDILESAGTSFIADSDGISEGNSVIFKIPLLDLQKLRDKHGLILEPSSEKFVQQEIFHEIPKVDGILERKNYSTDHIPRKGESSVTLAHLMSIRKPFCIEVETTIQNAAKILHENNLEAAAIVSNGKPYGIIENKHISQALSTGEDIQNPLSSFIPPTTKYLFSQTYKSDAEKSMTKWKENFAMVIDGDRVAGIVSFKDFIDRRSAAGSISRKIELAQDIESLKECYESINALASSYILEGVHPERLTKFISGMNDELTLKVIEMEIQRKNMYFHSFCWVSLGSEGRHEQSLFTDQDNAIIFEPDSSVSVEMAREEMINFAKSINEKLDYCGIDLCKGNIMASNPECCLTVNEWKAKFSNWIQVPTPDALVNATIFFDFQPLFGEVDLARELELWLSHEVRTNARFLHLMTMMALDREPPLSFLKNVQTDKEGKVDLKLSGITMFVDAARIFSLASGITERGTIERLKAAAKKHIIRESDVNQWIAAFNTLQTIRLQHQMKLHKNGKKPCNKLDPKHLDGMQSKSFIEALKTVKSIQNTISLKYTIKS